MSESTSATSEVGQRMLDIIEQILGYRPDESIEDLTIMDSLQILELLVMVEEEFEVDGDQIIEERPEWWSSLSGIVESIESLRSRSSNGPVQAAGG